MKKRRNMENGENSEVINQEEKQIPKINVEWILGKKIFNLGNKVYRNGDSLGIEIDGYGFPIEPALRKAYDLGFLKLKE